MRGVVRLYLICFFLYIALFFPRQLPLSSPYANHNVQSSNFKVQLPMSPEEQYKYVKLILPDGSKAENHAVLLHACCAPCSAAIVECMLRNGMNPTVYFSNSNIFPMQEYDIRKHELMRFLEAQHVPYVEDEYDHGQWLHAVKGLEQEPERGGRCSVCFRFRLAHAARYAQEHGFHLLTTTLASSRWKNIQQIDQAGHLAVENCPDVEWWDMNWRKGGLQTRRGELLRLNEFYNQLYCGCEFSLAVSQAMRSKSSEA